MIALLDTSVISQFTKVRPDERVVRWLAGVDTSDLCLSAVTVLEIRFGIERLDAGRRKSALSRWFEEELRQEYAGRILPINGEVADLAGRLIAKANDRSRIHMDALIAATGAVFGIPIATLDRADFESFEVALVEFWMGTGIAAART